LIFYWIIDCSRDHLVQSARRVDLPAPNIYVIFSNRQGIYRLSCGFIFMGKSLAAFCVTRSRQDKQPKFPIRHITSHFSMTNEGHRCSAQSRCGCLGIWSVSEMSFNSSSECNVLLGVWGWSRPVPTSGPLDIGQPCSVERVQLQANFFSKALPVLSLATDTLRRRS
jgi:hypothetical protein